MPAMIRWNKKANKIAMSILGLPDNRLDSASPKQKKIQKAILYEEGQWTR